MTTCHNPSVCYKAAGLTALMILLTGFSPAARGQQPTPSNSAAQPQASSAADWQTRDARQRRLEKEQLAALDAASRSRLNDAETEMREALLLLDEGNTNEALRRYRAALVKAEAILTAPCIQRVEQFLQLSDLSEAAYDFAGASQSLAQAEKQSAALFGIEHPLWLAALNRLGTLCYRTGQYELAESKLAAAVEMSRRLYGPLDPQHLTCVNNLAALEHARGRYGRALPLLLDVAQRIDQRYGQKHPQYATALNNLAGIDQSLGDFPRAAERLRQSLAIRQEALGPNHEDTLTSLNNLGGLYLQTGQPEEARRLFAEVAQARRQLSTEQPEYATTLSNLAAAHEALQNPVEAQLLSREALRIRERVLGSEHPDVATSLNNLALLLGATEHHSESEALLRRALAVRAKVLGKLHPDYAANLNNLAVHFRQCGRLRESADWYRQALDAQQQIIEDTLPALSERQQLSLLASLRRTLDGYLSIAPLANVEPAETYRHVLWWKGQVLVRQLARRRVVSGPAGAPLLKQLQAASGELAAAALAPAAGADAALRERRIQALSQERNRLETQIARLSSAPNAIAAASPRELAATLPPGAVLIDFLEYWRTAQPGVPPRAELAAFVMQREKQVVRLEFGAVDSLGESIETWLRTHGAPGKGDEAGLRLRDRIWNPLQAHVEQARLVLCSPDGCLTRLPLAALPGKAPGTYLIEEQSVVVLPVPQLLPSLLADSPPTQASLLLIGDIDYGQTLAASTAPGATGQLTFTRLPAARSEILAVKDSFERAFPTAPPPLVLRGNLASEEGFRRESSAHQFIHVVTHGFAGGPPSAAQPLSLQRHCGLALAGANGRASAGEDDGILTAAEAAELDLRHVELVVLSACDTGLGTVAAGEGVLGLQRAFQVAGAQTVIASLWKVDDRATQAMMDLFYERLWSGNDRLSRIEALRQAQLTILRVGSERGVGIVSRTPNEQRVAPYYWAAFVLSGDWR